MLYDWYYIKNLYDLKDCYKILNSCYDVRKDCEGLLVDSPGSNKKVNTYVLNSAPLHNILHKFFNTVYDLNRKYFGFDLYANYPDVIHLNEYYGNNNEYPYHRDAFQLGTMCDIKLTAIMNLSTEKFAGGDFELFYGENEKIDEIKNTGDFIIFPSYVYHRVTPVTEGKRITLSAWFTGPNWK